MADRGDTHYHVRSLNRWFAVSSLLLLVSAVWMVLDDWSRPWKRYQREFQQIEVVRARADLETVEALAALEEETRLGAALVAAEESLLVRQGELDQAHEELRLLKGDQFIVTENEKKAKQNYNWERFLADEHHAHHGDDDHFKELLVALKPFEDSKAALALEKLDADAAVLAKEAEIDALRAEVTLVEGDLKAATKGVGLVRKKLAGLAPEDFPTQLANIVRDFPGIDFIGPNLKVRKVIPPDLTFELNFTRKRRVDMCTTCHLPADLSGFEDEEQPFRSHPRLDLYLSSKSPHPLTQFGCTICHRGSGEALDFLRIDHRPSTEEEGERWHEEYGWHKKHYWDYPMLASGTIEASCVQCHKDSLELIAEDAPKVAAGYQLFERYGCYACHKVDWFPTKRRPGPGLVNILQKTTPEFIASWVSNPKGFRPTTWMPQIFYLENYGPEVKVVDSEYGQGRAIMGDEWSDAAVASVTAFIRSRSGAEPLPSIPAEGDALRGRDVFRLAGCLACHNLAPFTEEERAEAFDLAHMLRDTNEHGPNLRGVASKITPEWLFTWIKDPAAYWAETRMPDLRLSDQEAADVVAYVFEDPDEVFFDVPADWEAAPVAYERDVLEEQARWFFNRLRRDQLDESFAGEWSADEDLLVAVGERWVLNQGCHSCHQIPGLEDAQPIGTELTNWGSKTIDKLDFGFMPEILMERHGWSYREKLEFKEYRENFLELKLHEPRTFDRRKIKNPIERLRMPQFGLNDDQIGALTTFVVGLVDDEVQYAKMVPTPEQAAQDFGLRVMRQKNCAACHVIEPGTITWDDEDGHPTSVRGQFFVFEDEVLPPPLEDFQDYAAGYVDYIREDYDEEFELEEVYVELLEPTPGQGDVGTSVAIENVPSIRTEPAWGGDFVDLVTDHYLYADDVEDVDGERRAFAEEDYTKIRWTYAPPVLLGEGRKLQREWFFRFLLEPVPLREQMRVKMPTFNWAAGEAGAVADYFAIESKMRWPQRYARKLLLALDMTADEVTADIAARGIKAVTVAQVEGILAGGKVETKAAFPSLLLFGAALGFEMDGAVDPTYEPIPQRTPSVLEAFFARHADFYDQIGELATGPSGPTCTQCHFLAGQPPTNSTPIGWAPDLGHTRERLRPDWVRELLLDPSKVYPGTAMPQNFPPDQDQWQDLFPAPSREQIEAVLAWLFNLDRALIRN